MPTVFFQYFSPYHNVMTLSSLGNAEVPVDQDGELCYLAILGACR